MTDTSSPTSERADAGFPRPFGKFVLVHALGEGGMGAVYLAKAGGVAGIEKLCVVKTLRPALVADDDYAARFLDEARLVVQLAHRNICPVFDVGQIDGRYYLAMEHVAGRDLRRILARCRERGARLSEGAALLLMTEVVDALDYAHRLRDARSGDPLQLVHRDVSPQNIMVNFEGEVKLIDFGLALSTIKGQKTEPQSVMGKIAYMAPEHARGDPLDGSADQFSAAIVLFEALTATRYYGDLTPHEIWGVSGTGEHRPALLPLLGEDLQALLLRALHRDPRARFPSCGALREALEAALLARGIKTGDARRELRELMGALFDEERQAERQLLAELAVSEAAAVAAGPLSTPAGSAPATPAIEGFFEVTSAVPKGAAAGDERDVDATASHLEAAGLGPKRRSYGVVLGVAIAALVLVPAAWLLQSALAPPAPSTDVAPATSATADAPAASSSSGAEPARSDTAPSDAVANGGDAIPRDEAADRPIAAAPAPASAVPNGPASSSDDDDDDDEPSRAAQRPRQGSRASKKAQRPSPPTGYKPMLSYVKRWCGHERCTAEVLAHDETMRAKGEPSTEDLLRSVKALRRCVERCAE